MTAVDTRRNLHYNHHLHFDMATGTLSALLMSR